MADTPASTTGTSHDFDLSSDEEDDILQNLKQQAQRGTRSSASYDPDASSNFGKTTASSEGTPNFESMRDAFREAGMEALETKSPVAAPPTVASADESIRVDFGQAAQRQSLAHQSIASVDGVMLQSRDGAVAEEPQPQTDETSVYSPPGAEEEKAPLATDATSVYSPPGASEAQPTVNTSADEFAALAAAQEDSDESEEEEGDDPEDRHAREYVGSALKPAKKAALERLVEQLQRDNDRLQASLQLAYERAEAAKQEWEAVRSRRPKSVPSHHASSPGEEGGLFFEFEAVRTATPRAGTRITSKAGQGGRHRGEIGHCILQISVQEGARGTGQERDGSPSFSPCSGIAVSQGAGRSPG
jgi:hypothetical protein